MNKNLRIAIFFGIILLVGIVAVINEPMILGMFTLNNDNYVNYYNKIPPCYWEKINGSMFCTGIEEECIIWEYDKYINSRNWVVHTCYPKPLNTGCSSCHS